MQFLLDASFSSTTMVIMRIFDVLPNTSCFTSCRTISDLKPSLPPKKKILSTLAKESLKIEIELFPLFHMKTKVFLKYFVRGLVWFTKRQSLWPHNFFDANTYCYHKTSSNVRKKSNFSKAPNSVFTLDASFSETAVRKCSTK